MSALLHAASVVVAASAGNFQSASAQQSMYGNGFGGTATNGARGANNAFGNGTGGGNQYYGAVQANIHTGALSGNKEMLRNDVDYEDYLLQKRTAFNNQMQMNEQSEEKLRAYAEQRLKTLGQSKTSAPRTLSAAEQAEAHDLIDWLKKDAEQRANNRAWLKRQDQALAYLEQDQFVSLKNQRNSLHNLMEDGIAVQDQFKWNQQMQLAQLHIQQNQQGAFNYRIPGQTGLNNGYAGYGFGGYGYGGYGYGGYGYGRRWGF